MILSSSFLYFLSVSGAGASIRKPLALPTIMERMQGRKEDSDLSMDGWMIEDGVSDDGEWVDVGHRGRRAPLFGGFGRRQSRVAKAKMEVSYLEEGEYVDVRGEFRRPHVPVQRMDGRRGAHVYGFDNLSDLENELPSTNRWETSLVDDYNVVSPFREPSTLTERLGSFGRRRMKNISDFFSFMGRILKGGLYLTFGVPVAVWNAWSEAREMSRRAEEIGYKDWRNNAKALACREGTRQILRGAAGGAYLLGSSACGLLRREEEVDYLDDSAMSELESRVQQRQWRMGRRRQEESVSWLQHIGEGVSDFYDKDVRHVASDIWEQRRRFMGGGWSSQI